MRETTWQAVLNTVFCQPISIMALPKSFLQGLSRHNAAQVISRAATVYMKVSRTQGHCAPSNSLSHWTVRQYSTLYKRSLLMKQFDQIKSQHPNYILLFQVGDFYELYGDDASEVTAKTSLRLTRNKANLFMAGFPTKNLSEWQRVLVEAGFQLAICDQFPPKEGEKTRLLGREVVQLVTPGTLVEPLDNQANYLLSIVPGPGATVGLAWLDVSTAEFCVTSTEVQDIEEDIERICPSEVLLPEDVSAAVEYGGRGPPLSPSLDGLIKCSLLRECHVTSIPPSWYSESHDHHLGNLEVAKHLKQQDFSNLEVMAAAGLLRFVMHTQKSVVPFLSPPVRYSHQLHMAIDTSTRRALELVTPLYSNTRKTTLLGCMDRTVTAAGERLLKARLSSPLTSIPDINRRLDTVELFSKEVFHCEMIIGMLKKCADLERILQKVATNSANISDLQAIKTTLAVAMEIISYIRTNLEDWHILEPDLEGHDLSELVGELDSALTGDTFGDYISTGYSEKVDSLRDELKLNTEGLNTLVKSLHSTHPNLPRLNVVSHKAYIRVFEMSKAQAAKMGGCRELVRVDAIQSKVRFSHVELQRLNAELQHLELSYSTAQSQLFRELCEQVILEADRIKGTALVLARLDVSSSLGTLAKERSYSRPTLVDDPGVFRVRGATHPVISSVQQGTFVSNDCVMDQHRLWVVTGPNMGGKSTFLRQNALLAILAQMGSFVPAEGVVMGVVNRLFARVGASDNVAKHQSTFHMEMTETANILNNATSQSFVILDEIGRGTSTAEGVCIAQAVIEYLHDKLGCRTLVATHYHQLSSLADTHQTIGCYKLVANSNDNGILFTYKIEPGFVEESFATDVARLAGVPQRVVDRAKELLLLARK